MLKNETLTGRIQLSVSSFEIEKKCAISKKVEYKLHVPTFKIGIPNDVWRIPITGKSGTGKTTLLRVLSGLNFIDTNPKVNWSLLLNTKGKKEIFKYQIGAKMDKGELLEFRRHISVISFQHSPMVDSLSIYDNMLLRLNWPSVATNSPKLSRKEKSNLIQLFIEKAFDEKKMGEKLLKRYPSELSGGQRVRFSIIQNLINDPCLVFADEPMGSLDPDSQKEMWAFLRWWALEKNCGRPLIIYASHNDKDYSNGDWNIEKCDDTNFKMNIPKIKHGESHVI